MKGVDGADINSVVFDFESKRIATSADDFSVRIWNAETGVQLAKLKGHEDWVWNSAFSPDGNHVASASLDMTARIWDAASGKELLVLKGHRAALRDVIYDPKGRYIATASGDRTIRFWDPESGDELRRIEGHQGRITALAVSRDGTLIASSSYDGTVKLWRALNGSRVASFSGAGKLSDVAFSPRETRLAAVSEEGKGYVWDINGGRVATLSDGTKLFAAQFADEGRLLTTAGNDGKIRLWSISTGQILREFKGHEAGIRGLDISADGTVLASGSRDNTARIWDVESGRQIKIMGHVSPALDLPQAIDQPPYFVASRAPVPVDLAEDRRVVQDYAIKGFGIAFALLFGALVLKGILSLIRQRTLSRWVIVGSLGVVTGYVALLMLSAFPVEATYLWLLVAFVPMTVLAILRYVMTLSTGGRL